ncbi:MAG: AraC family transcriptional regulator [Usitatibacter sp.]
MDRQKAPGLGSLPRTAGMATRAACSEARKAGLAVGPLLAQANLTVEQVDNARARLLARDQVRFLDIVANALDDDLFGFHLARSLELREAGLVYYVMASSRTVLEAIQRIVRYGSIVNEGVLQRCVVGRNLDVTLHHVGTSRHLDRHHTEGWAAMIVGALRQLTAKRITPVRVRFVHPRARRPTELLQFFGCPVEFGARTDEMRFERTAGDTPIVGADPYLNKVLVGYCEEALAHRRPARGAFRSRVENAIVPLLPHGEARAAEVAGRLGLSERTLARRLGAEGITFTTLLDRLRLDLAHRYLADADTSISQIAWLLGYKEVSGFSKAFKRWTGSSPREARKAPAAA